MAKKQVQQAPENIEAVTKTEAFIDKYKKHIVYGICAIIVIAAAIINVGRRCTSCQSDLFAEAVIGHSGHDGRDFTSGNAAVGRVGSLVVTSGEDPSPVQHVDRTGVWIARFHIRDGVISHVVDAFQCLRRKSRF